MAKIESVCMSNRGKVRSRNEDNFLFCGLIREDDPQSESLQYYTNCLKKQDSLMGVFDGMGGLYDGNIASQMVASHFSEKCPKDIDSVKKWFEIEYRSVNKFISDFFYSKGENSGSTAAIMYFYKRNVVVSNVGDSRVYRFRNGVLSQLSHDHSDGDFLASLGVIDRPASLYQFLGMPPKYEVQPDTEIFDVKKNDIYLCCSDGLYSMISNEQLINILNNNEIITKKAEALMSAALDQGGEDNITFIISRVASCFF